MGRRAFFHTENGVAKVLNETRERGARLFLRDAYPAVGSHRYEVLPLHQHRAATLAGDDATSSLDTGTALGDNPFAIMLQKDAAAGFAHAPAFGTGDSLRAGT